MGNMRDKINKKCLYSLALIAAFLVVYYGFGKPHILPWQKTIPLKMPAAVAAAGKNVLIADDASDRILFVNRTGKVSRIMSVSQLKPSFDKIKSISANGDYIYILGYNVKFGTFQVTKEHIEKYSNSGRHIKTLYETSPPTNTQRTCSCLSRLCLNGKTVVFTQISNNRKSAGVYEIPEDTGAINNPPKKICSFAGTEDLLSAEYNPKNKKFVCTDIFGDAYIKNAATDKVHPAKEAKDYFAGDGSTFEAAVAELRKTGESAESEKEILPCNIKVAAEKNEKEERLFFLSYLQNGITLYHSATKKLTVLNELPIAAAMRMAALLYWASLFLLLFALLKFLYGIAKKGLSQKVKIAMAIVFVAAVFIGFYSRALSEMMCEQYTARMDTLCRIIAQYIESNAQQFICRTDRYNPRDYCLSKANRKEISKLKATVATFATDAGRGDLYAAVYLFGKDKRFYMLCDSHDFANSGFRLPAPWTNRLLRNSGDLASESYSREKADTNNTGITISRHIALRDTNKKVSLVVFCGSFIRHLKKKVIVMSFKTLVSVLAVLVGTFVFLTIIPVLSRKMKTYFATRRTNKEEAAMALVAPYCFVVYLLQNIDMVLFILVSAQLSEGNAAKLALPALFASAGAVAGKVLQLLLIRVYKNKTVMIFSGVTMTLSYLATALAVSKNSLIIFVWAQFVNSLCLQGFVKTIVYKMSYGCTDEKLKRDATVSGVIGKNAGSILALFAGGCIATLFDYKTVYLASAALALLLALLFASTYMDCEKEEKEKFSFAALASGLNLFTVIFRPEMLLFTVFILLLKTSVGVYPETIFPLFAAASQISVFLLSNLTMFVKASTYFLTGKINRIMSKLDIPPGGMAALFNIATGLVFIAFWVNNNILWAIIILFVLDVISDTSGTCCGLYVSSLGEKYELSGSDMIAVMQIIYGFGRLASSALILLLAFGYETACGIIGIMYIAAALIFKAFCGKTRHCR